jgi:hypothetical protein
MLRYGQVFNRIYYDKRVVGVFVRFFVRRFNLFTDKPPQYGPEG